jgi:hypothetical protein
MTVSANVEVRLHRPVGDDHVETLDREFGKQRREAPFAADQPDVFFEAENGLDQVMRDGFRDGIRDSDLKEECFLRFVIVQDIEQLVAQAEDRLCVREDAPSGFGQFAVPTAGPKKFDAEPLFEFAELSADRLRRQMQLFGGARDAPHFGDDPEITQVLEIQRVHDSFPETFRPFRRHASKESFFSMFLSIIFDLLDIFSGFTIAPKRMKRRPEQAPA